MIVGDADSEATAFAQALRKLLNEAGYGAGTEQVVRMPKLKLRRPENERSSSVVALFNSATSEAPATRTNYFAYSVLMFYPSSSTIASGDSRGDRNPAAYHYSPDDPNDVLRGIVSVLSHVGIRSGRGSGFRILKPGEIGLFIPNQVD